MLVQAGPPVGRQEPRAQPRFTTTVDIADFVPQNQVQEPVFQQPDVFANQQYHQEQSQRDINLAQQELIIERSQDHHLISRNQSQASAPRNIHGALRDRGDRALENIDEHHPGLPGDDITERSQSGISYRHASQRAGGMLLALDIDADESFIEANSEGGLVGRNHLQEENK